MRFGLVTEVSPDIRALAGFTADLLWIGLAGLLLFAAIDRYAPPQDLPWKPLHVSQPLGFATTMKLDRVASDPLTCRSFVDAEGVAFSPVPDRTQDAFCAIENAGRLGPQDLQFRPGSPVVTCGLAAATAIWARQVVQPAAREVLGSDVAAIEHFGAYACRRIYGRPEGRVSQHALAAAVDVAAFRLADGRRITVRGNWDGRGPEADFLRRVRNDGCRLFRAVLSPDYNAAHADHLHLDMGPYRLCR